MEFTDKSIVCSDCGVEFVHSADDQSRYAERGFTNEPKRCRPCREQRKAAIAAFWDRVIAPNRVMFDIARSYACGSECANVGSITSVMANGATTIVNGVFSYRVNDAGRVTNLRAYWEIGNIKVFPPVA